MWNEAGDDDVVFLYVHRAQNRWAPRQHQREPTKIHSHTHTIFQIDIFCRAIWLKPEKYCNQTHTNAHTHTQLNKLNTYAAKFLDFQFNFTGNRMFFNIQIKSKVDQWFGSFDEFAFVCVILPGLPSFWETFKREKKKQYSN